MKGTLATQILIPLRGERDLEAMHESWRALIRDLRELFRSNRIVGSRTYQVQSPDSVPDDFAPELVAEVADSFPCLIVNVTYLRSDPPVDDLVELQRRYQMAVLFEGDV